MYQQTVKPDIIKYKVKGMTMINKQEIRYFIDDLISHYAKAKDSTGYQLSVETLPDIDLNAFISLIMSANDDLACDALGPNNPEFMNKMLPALMKHLDNTTDKDITLKFIETWHSSIASYYMIFLQELVDTRLSEYNGDRGYKAFEYSEPQSRFI